MSNTLIKAAIFDAYGTLLDVHAAMQRHQAALPPDWPAISAEWRSKQLEYTWVRSLTGAGHHRNFWQVTEDALEFVAARHHLTDPAVTAALLDAYRRLPPYPDAASMLRAVRAQGIAPAILSNGDPAMLRDAVESAGLAPLLDDVLSAESVGVFKPDPRVYALVTARFGHDPAEIAFVSSNAWDAQGAAAFGFRVFWCNRASLPDEYGLGQVATEIASLSALPALLAEP